MRYIFQIILCYYLLFVLGPSELDQKRTAFHNSMQMKEVIAAVSKPTKWPPEAEDMTLEDAQRVVPPQLYNSLAWTCGLSSQLEDDQEGYVKVGTKKERQKLLSICQDIVSLAHRGRIMTPKQYALGMTVRHLTGSSTLINILNGLGQLFCSMIQLLASFS